VGRGEINLIPSFFFFMHMYCTYAVVTFSSWSIYPTFTYAVKVHNIKLIPDGGVDILNLAEHVL
jgi:1-acyl-sn-glycerol-3-phosphate acyltransferase